MNALSGKSFPLSAEPQNLFVQNDHSSFADFSDIKSLLDDMVNFVDVNVIKENDTVPSAVASANESLNQVEEPYYRHFDVFVIDAQKTWPDRISTIGMKIILLNCFLNLYLKLCFFLKSAIVCVLYRTTPCFDLLHSCIIFTHYYAFKVQRQTDD